MSVPAENGTPPQPLQGGPLAMLTLAVALATFMEILDLSIANVAVPTIAGNLGVSSSQGTWVISSYSVASAIMLPLTGWISKRFGEVRVFSLSVVLFVFMSMMCGLSTSLPMLVFFRLMQGMVSGPMVPLSQSLMLNNYPPERRGTALALWSMTIIIAPIAGPILGGWITDNFSWPRRILLHQRTDRIDSGANHLEYAEETRDAYVETADRRDRPGAARGRCRQPAADARQTAIRPGPGFGLRRSSSRSPSSPSLPCAISSSGN